MSHINLLQNARKNTDNITNYLHEKGSSSKALFSLFLWSFSSCFSPFSWSSLSRVWRAMSVCGRRNPWLRSSRAPLLSKPVAYWPRGTWRPTPTLPLLRWGRGDAAFMWCGLNEFMVQTKYKAEEEIWFLQMLGLESLFAASQTLNYFRCLCNAYDEKCMTLISCSNSYGVWKCRAYIWSISYCYITTSNQLSVAIVTQENVCVSVFKKKQLTQQKIMNINTDFLAASAFFCLFLPFWIDFPIET